ncbi:MAG: hypothetical protein KGJ59_08905 [Bacteroidota bacterium]|nr:hypothetical protein [Bacteroidota bacterium]
MFRIIFLSIALGTFAMSQTPDSLNYFPVHAGDIRQYRSQFTGEITGTLYTDSVVVDSISKNVFAFEHGGGGGNIITGLIHWVTSII